MKNIFFLSFSLFFLCQVCVSGQEVISSTGGHFLKNNVQISWTIGEPLIETFQNNDIILTQGVHQPLLVVTSLENISGSSIIVSAYPNPTQDKVNIRVGNLNKEKLDFSLYDFNGKLLVRNNISSYITIVSMAQFAPATYLLKISSETYPVKAFRIVKTK